MNESSTMMSFAFSGCYLKISLILSRSGLPPLQWHIFARQGKARQGKAVQLVFSFSGR